MDFWKDLYSWRFVDDTTRDIRAWEIRRLLTDEEPFAVLINAHSVVGDERLFSDIFYSDAWDMGRSTTLSDDVKFLIDLWIHLGLYDKTGEYFQPKHLLISPDRIPLVWRNNLENVMSRRYGCGHTQFSTEPGPVGETPVVKLNFTTRDTDEEIEAKIIAGFEKGKSINSPLSSRA